MAGVSVGTGAVIGCRAVVTRDIPEYAIAVGIPARIIRFRHSPESVAALLRSHWWKIDPDILLQLPMDDPAKFLQILENRVPSPNATYRALKLTRTSYARIDTMQTSPPKLMQ